MLTTMTAAATNGIQIKLMLYTADLRSCSAPLRAGLLHVASSRSSSKADLRRISEIIVHTKAPNRNNQPKMTGRKEAGKSNRVAAISKPQAVEIRPTMAEAS